MGADADSCGRRDDRCQATFQWAMVATIRTAAAAAGLGCEPAVDAAMGHPVNLAAATAGDAAGGYLRSS